MKELHFEVQAVQLRPGDAPLEHPGTSRIQFFWQLVGPDDSVLCTSDLLPSAASCREATSLVRTATTLTPTVYKGPQP